MEPELPLERLFLHLVNDRGFPLTVRDYQDALRALAMGYGGRDRQSLLRLLETLWVRTEEESRQLNLLFREISVPTDEEIAALLGGEPPPPPKPKEDTDNVVQGEASGEPAQVPQIQFSASTQAGLGLPQAQVAPSGREPFILHPRPPVSLRSLIVTWRRFRRAIRSGPKVELDLAATIAEQSRRGYLTQPVLVPSRRNLARLVVLVDASPSMAAWRSLHPALAESLREGRLGLAALYFFHNVPDEHLYETETLTGAVPVGELLERHAGSTLLIVSDAGAARGRRDRERIESTRQFLDRVSGSWQPVAWVNPMPRRRWKGTSAERIARFSSLTMTELNEDGLIQAIDLLRGRRSA
ncbi:MAG TPA: hypothetical protein VKM72_08210 [Thermoanaerobaculia bacterium]|nr:hypothetical protein [Thermoanaerobaculia bacterium]